MLNLILVSLIIGLGMILFCKVENFLLLVYKISNQRQYLYSRAIINVKYCLNRHYFFVWMVYEIVCVFAFLFLVMGLSKANYYISWAVFSNFRAVPFLFATISLSGNKDRYEIFQLEIKKDYKQMKKVIPLSNVLFSVISATSFGGIEAIKIFACSLMVFGQILIAIWVLSGGPGRLITNVSRKLKKHKHTIVYEN